MNANPLSSLPLATWIHATVASGSAVAMALVCLVQYLYSLARTAHAHHIAETFRKEVEGLANEVQVLNRDRAVTRFENEILREVVCQTDLAKSLGLLLKRFVPHPTDHFAAFLLLADGQERLLQSRGLSEDSCRRFRLDADQLERLHAEQALVLDGPLLRQCQFFRLLAPPDRRKAERVFLICVSDGDKMLGVLVSTSLVPAGAPHAEQLELAKRLMASLGGNLRQTIALEQQSNQLKCTREMLELRAIADAPLDQPLKSLERFLIRLSEILGSERSALYLLTVDAGGITKPLVRTGTPQQFGLESRWREHEDTLARAALVFNELTTFDAATLKELGVDSLLGAAITVPLVRNGQTLGVLCLSRRDRVVPSDVQLDLVQWAAECLAETIQRVVSYAAIERQARQDGLTQLANRRTFDFQIERELESVRQNATECALLLVDLDRFKSVNDRFGHQAGDEVLRVASRRLRTEVSRSAASERALLARYGGEEMAVLLPGVDLDGALRLAEAIRTSMAADPIEFNEQRISVTLSVGAAAAPQHGRTPREIIAAADAALYQAKAGGRNRVCSPSEVLV